VTSVSIVVPTFRRPRALRLTLRGLMALDHQAGDLEVIVVDDGDDPGTSEIVDGLRGDVSITLLTQHRRGAASARNAGARAAQGELLIFCDDDMVVAPSHVAQHLATHVAYPNAMAGSDRWYTRAALTALESTRFGRYRVELERGFRDRLDEPLLEGDCTEARILAACDLSVQRTAFWDLGGFDEDFPHAGAEDQDFSLRARHAGLQLVRNRAIRPEHEEDIVTLAGFCWREERGAETVVVLGQRFPDAVGEFAENGPVRRGDRPALMVKKLAKSALDRRVPLAGLHRLAALLERTPVPDARLHRLYRGIIALHIHRGYRRALITRA
jgi:glycosyltransferase involved in cell wall biosynthesis